MFGLYHGCRQSRRYDGYSIPRLFYIACRLVRYFQCLIGLILDYSPSSKGETRSCLYYCQFTGQPQSDLGTVPVSQLAGSSIYRGCRRILLDGYSTHFVQTAFATNSGFCVAAAAMALLIKLLLKKRNRQLEEDQARITPEAWDAMPEAEKDMMTFRYVT